MGSPPSHHEAPIGVLPRQDSIREKLLRTQRQFALTRLVALAFAVVVIVLLVADARRVRQQLYPGLVAAHSMLTEVEAAHPALRAHVASPHSRTLRDWEEQWTATSTSMDALRAEYGQRVVPTERMLKELRTREEALVNGLPGAAPEQTVTALAAIAGMYEGVRAELHQLIEEETTLLHATVQRSTTIGVAAMVLVIAVMVITFLVAHRVVQQVNRTIIEPVELLVESATQLAGGKLREDVPIKSNDELGRLGRALNQLRVSLALAEMKYRSLFANTSNSMVLLDANTYEITDANRSFEELTGSKRRQLQQKNVLDLFEPEQRAVLEEGLRNAQAQGQFTVSGLHMTTLPRLMAVLDVRITCVDVSSDKVMELTFLDVTEQYVKNQALSEIAFKDELTGLFNHRSFYQKLNEEIQQAREGQSSLVLLFVDLDNFKQCNDTYGHQVGDQLLRNVGQLVRDHIRQARDSGFRYGGDEFAVLLPDAKVNVAERIAHQVREGFESIEQYGTSMSIGVAAWKPDMDGEALVKAADGALYAAKSAGKNTVRISA